MFRVDTENHGPYTNFGFNREAFTTKYIVAPREWKKNSCLQNIQKTNPVLGNNLQNQIVARRVETKTLVVEQFKK